MMQASGSQEEQGRDLAPNGMLESWNNGVASGLWGTRIEEDTVI